MGASVGASPEEAPAARPLRASRRAEPRRSLRCGCRTLLRRAALGRPAASLHVPRADPLTEWHYVAQRFAVDNPGRTLGLALVGCPRSLRGLRPPFADVLATLADPIDAVFARELTEGMVAREVPEAVMAMLCKENLKVPARVWRDAFEGLTAADPPLESGRISVPTLIVWGARDSLLPRGDQEAMATEIPGARVGGLPRRRPPAGTRGARARGRRHRSALRGGRCAVDGSGGLLSALPLTPA
jgi:hypothetical protein